MNWQFAVFVLVAIITAVNWNFNSQHNFAGPKRYAEVELETKEEDLEQDVAILGTKY